MTRFFVPGKLGFHKITTLSCFGLAIVAPFSEGTDLQRDNDEASEFCMIYQKVTLHQHQQMGIVVG